MLFAIIKVLPVLALSGLGAANSMAWNKRRDVSGSDIGLYAYGGKTNGAPVFYDNGLAYIGNSPISSSSTNISFSVTEDASTTPWYISPNTTTSSNTSTSFTGTPALYIIPTTNSFSQAGFTTTANISDVPAGAETTGFSWFGTAVSFAGEESAFEMAFWAVETETEGVWSLYWGKNNTELDVSSSIVLKSTPPTTG